jgi:DNA-binding MltR family transcriptional regulator
MAAAFGKGPLLRFEPKESAIVREGSGLVHVTVKGAAVTRGALYEPVSIEDAGVLAPSILDQWRKARERAAFLQRRAGINVPAVDEKPFVFVRETTPMGKSVEFQFQFKARRNGSDWKVDRIVSADLTPADALRGQPITEFSSPAIIGTDKANRDKQLFTEAIDKFVADVNKANAQAIRRFAKEGLDADGKPLFPVDGAMPGERFAQTRLRSLQTIEVQNWTDADLQYAINEALARHGLVFDDKKITGLFSNLSWYRPRRDLSPQQIEDSLSEVELQNIRTLVSVAVTRKENAERARQAAEMARQNALAQKRQQDALKAQQEAQIQAQRQQAAALIIGGIIQGIINHRK